jgi:hypothetical protein
MSLSENINERTWTAIEVLSLACAFNRERGFTSVSKVSFAEPTDTARWTNKDMLSYTLVPEITSKDFNVLVKVKPCDLEEAAAIIKYYRRLSFGVLAENINDYLQRVFHVTQTEQVKFKDFGVIASVPSVYAKEVHGKEILNQIKTTKNEHLGIENQTLDLTVVVLETKLVEQIGCWSHLAITNDDYLVSFLSKNRLLESKQIAKIRGKVKKHSQHWKTKTAETQLNYVKVVDNSLDWQ